MLSAVTGCGFMPDAPEGYGSRHTIRLQHPPEKAARCFARNAEEHSSALISEVTMAANGSADVVVRVKNGVTYATADIQPAGQGSAASIVLMVTTTGQRSDLLSALIEGC